MLKIMLMRLETEDDDDAAKQLQYDTSETPI
jgi:hypothetical protein